MFLIIWSVCGLAGAFDNTHRQVFPRAVVFTTVMSLASMPVVAYWARREVIPTLAWALLLSSTVMVLTPVGVYLLLYAPVDAIRAACGVMFAVFGAGKLWQSLTRVPPKAAAAPTSPYAASSSAADVASAASLPAAMDGRQSARFAKVVPLDLSPGATADAAVVVDDPTDAVGAAAPSAAIAGAVDRTYDRVGDVGSSAGVRANSGSSENSSAALLAGPRAGDYSVPARGTGDGTSVTPVSGDATDSHDGSVNVNVGVNAGAVVELAGSPLAVGDQPALLHSVPDADADADSFDALPPWRRRMRRLIAVWLPLFNPRYNRTATVVMMLTAGAGSGLAGGMLSVGGPPLIVCFTVLKMHPDVQRGMTVVSTLLSNITRLVSIARSSQPVFLEQDVPSYIGIVIATMLGIVLGSYVRTKLETETILRWLFVVLIFATATMFDVHKSALSVALFLGALVLYFVSLSSYRRFVLLRALAANGHGGIDGGASQSRTCGAVLCRSPALCRPKQEESAAQP
jgi:uncharacterized membrane protein YfcA